MASDEPAPAELCRDAIELVERALRMPPREIKEEVDDGERAIVRLRNRLIDLLRQGDDSEEAPRRRAALDRANVALSLVAGIEYPPAGIQRKSLEQARDVLERMLADGLSSPEHGGTER